MTLTQTICRLALSAAAVVGFAAVTTVATAKPMTPQELAEKPQVKQVVEYDLTAKTPEEQRYFCHHFTDHYYRHSGPGRCSRASGYQADSVDFVSVRIGLRENTRGNIVGGAVVYAICRGGPEDGKTIRLSLEHRHDWWKVDEDAEVY